MNRLCKVYFNFCCIILLISSTGKCLSLWGNFANGLAADPVIQALYVRDLLIIAMVLELAVVALLVYSPSLTVKATALISLSAIIVAYRAGRLLYKVHEPCNCMGLIEKYFPISFARFESMLFWAILLFFIVGAYLALLSGLSASSSCKR